MRIKTELIISFMNKYGIKPFRMCALCNVSRRQLQNVLDNSISATCYTLIKIAKLMEIPLFDLIETE